MRLMEDKDEDYDTFAHLPSINVVKALKPQIAAAAQKVYDRWEQGEDDDLNGGGICHLIADEAATVLMHAHVPVATQCSSHEQHVYCVCQCLEGVFEVDIPHRMYERGSMFTWTKLPDVQITPDDVIITRLDGNPGRMGIYVEDWQDD
jgi:hypothetical protein